MIVPWLPWAWFWTAAGLSGVDRGIATEDNVAWLIAHGYRYLVVSRERDRQFEEGLPVIETTTAAEEVIRLQRVLSPDGSEVRLYCFSEKRAEKGGLGDVGDSVDLLHEFH